MSIDLTFESDGHVFNARTAAIIKHNGFVLCDNEEGTNFSYLPGGRIQRGEDSARALERELREELNIHVKAVSPRITTESFYDGEDGRYHELSFYYVIEKPTNLKFTPGEICHTHYNDGQAYHHHWVRAAPHELNAAMVYPLQLHHHLVDLPKAPVHVTISE